MVSNPESPYFTSDTFNKMIDFLQKGTNKGKLKQTGKNFLLVVEPMRGMNILQEFLNQMSEFVIEK